MATVLPEFDRSRVGWWLLTIALGFALAFVLYALVGTFVLGAFVYYGMRPLQRRLQRFLSPGFAAALALVTIALPALLLVGSLVALGVQEVGVGAGAETITETLERYVGLAPIEASAERLGEVTAGADTGTLRGIVALGAGALAFLADGLLHVFIAVAVAFYLLRDDAHIANWFRSNVAGEGTAAHAYATAVDRDLGTIYFGNVLLIGLVAVLATAFYHGYNVLAPAPVAIPAPTALAVLTGLASLIPIVVGKLVYVPLVAYLGAVAFRTDLSLLVYPLGLLAVCFVAVDLVPMGYLLPRIAGRKTHVGLVLFAYVLGPVLFGWYGLFFGPLLLVLGVQLVRIAFTELIHGEPISPRTTSAESIGADPERGGD